MRSLIFSLPLVAILSACGGGSESDVFVNETRSMAEGTQLSYTLPSGRYQAEITASNNGVLVSWPGGNGCVESGEVRSYAAICNMPSKGQLVIVNPTVFGLGGDEIVTIKITDL